MNRVKLFLALVLVFAVASVFAQSSGKLFTAPERLALNGWGEPDPNLKETDYQPILTESFYPIGWSRDGKFAYLVEPPDEACGCYYAEIVIQDLKTDKIIWKERWDSAELEKPEEEDIDSFWKRKGKEYSAKLSEHAIEPIGRARLLHPSIKFESDVLTPKLEVRIKTDNVFEVDGTVTLTLRSKKRGSKIVRRDVYRKKDTNGFRDAEVSGSLKSPFESRVAIVVVEEVRGWEGPPNVTQIRIVGSTLTTGFKK